MNVSFKKHVQYLFLSLIVIFTFTNPCNAQSLAGLYGGLYDGLYSGAGLLVIKTGAVEAGSLMPIIF